MDFLARIPAYLDSAPATTVNMGRALGAATAARLLTKGRVERHLCRQQIEELVAMAFTAGHKHAVATAAKKA